MGSPKAALVVDGTSLAERTAHLLARVADPVLEVGPGYTGLMRVVEVPAGGGPLAAMTAGWRALADVASGRRTGSWDPTDANVPGNVLVVATDLPLLTEGMLRLLADHPGVGCVVPVDDSGRAQPLCARYPAAAMDRAVALTRAGHRAVMTLFDRGPVTWLPPSEWQSAGGANGLADVDTPEDLARALPTGEAGR
jgi:molybdopterin-guanine dinucleotide biosynthesis protein A